jgi:hypothetical protein
MRPRYPTTWRRKAAGVLISSAFTTGWCARGGRHGTKPVAFLARWPSDKAMQHARDRIRDLTARSRLRLWPELIAEDLNRVLRGWGAYFRFGNWPAGPHWLVGARATSWRVTGI